MQCPTVTKPLDILRAWQLLMCWNVESQTIEVGETCRDSPVGLTQNPTCDWAALSSAVFRWRPYSGPSSWYNCRTFSGSFGDEALEYLWVSCVSSLHLWHLCHVKGFRFLMACRQPKRATAELNSDFAILVRRMEQRHRFKPWPNGITKSFVQQLAQNE